MDPPHVVNPKPMELLGKIANSLLDYMEGCTSHEESNEAQDLKKHIVSATLAAEALQESHLADAGFDQNCSNSAQPMDIQEVIEEIYSAQLKVENERGTYNSTTLKRDQRLEMAAYAAVVSLMNTMEQIMDHPRLATSFDPKQMESLHEILDFLLDFMEEGSKEARDLEIQIASAALAAEDVLESHLADQIHAGFDQITSNSPLNLQSVIEEMDSVKLNVEKERAILRNVQPTYPKSPAPTWTTKPPKTHMVGNDEELHQLLDVLTGHNSSRQIISIIGMGGIGKTTLARNAFESRIIIGHFIIRGWVTISQSYCVTELLSELLSCLPIQNIASPSEIGQEQLGLKLFQYLYGRRYLIVLDDIWGIESWEKLKFFFPDNGNGSRIVVTTRLSNVATLCSSSIVRMNFLDGEKSWDLLCKTVFPREDYPLELEDIGKKIVEKCKGLPLSIVVIGGFLAKCGRSKEYWENVIGDINSSLKSDDDDAEGLCLDLLSLSYTHLPVHLKPCFLYMGILEEDERIDVSQLIKLLAAEGFLRPNKIQSFEEIAHDYIKELADRNLILVSEWRWNGTTKVCCIHDLLREVCLREAEKEKFLLMECGRRKRERSKDIRVFDALISAELTCSLIYKGIAISAELSEEVKHSEDPGVFAPIRSEALVQSLTLKDGPFPSKYRLLKVVTTVKDCPLETVFQQVSSRYLLYEPFGDSGALLPSSAFRQWNMQTLIFKGIIGRTVAPPEIWNMRQLRHLEYKKICLPDPPTSDDSVLHNLQTLVDVVNFCFSEDICKRIPNVKKLHISYDKFSDECLGIDIGSLSKLHSLKCTFDEKMKDLVVELTFPSSLQKLSLSGCCLHFDNVTAVGLMLPNLQVLNLDMVTGPEWNLVEEEAYPRLKSLSVSNSDLIYWTAEESHFPVLEKLFLRNLRVLDGIPLGFGEISTLGSLVLSSCNESAAISSTKILGEQLSLGNDEIEVRIAFQDMEEFDRFKEMVDTTHFPKQNFDCSNHDLYVIVEAVGTLKKLQRTMLHHSLNNLGKKYGIL